MKNKEIKELKGAIKDTSICKYFCGIKYLDSVLCSYPYENLIGPKKRRISIK